MKFQIVVSALAGMAMATYDMQPKQQEPPCSTDMASVAGHLPSAAPVYGGSAWVPAPPKSYPAGGSWAPAPSSPPPPPPQGDISGDEDDDCPCRKKKSSSLAAQPTGAPYVPSNASYPSTPSNYTNPSQTYTPAQVSANAGSHNGPAVAGVFGLAAILALL